LRLSASAVGCHHRPDHWPGRLCV